jgi:hypothetical protein
VRVSVTEFEAATFDSFEKQYLCFIVVTFFFVRALQAVGLPERHSC